VALLGDEVRNHVTSHFRDAEAVQVKPTAHHPMNLTLRTIQKMSRLSSANVAEHAVVLRLKMVLIRVLRETMKTDLQQNIWGVQRHA
jgi:hypothetical protein